MSAPRKRWSSRCRSARILAEALERRTLYSQIDGTAFFDRNNNGVQDSGEELLVDVPVFADYDGDRLYDSNEPFVFSSPGGVFSLSDVLPGTYPLGVGDPSLWMGPDSPTPLDVAPDATTSGVNLPVRTPVRDPASFADSEEVGVNTYTGTSQALPAVVMRDNGEYVIVWSSSGQDGNGGGIFARRFAADGSPQGTEFLVNQYTTGNQGDLEVAMYTDGSFVVVWEGVGAEDSLGVYARRFDANGDPSGDQVLVNSYTTGSQVNPVVAVDGSGIVTIVWDGSGPADSAGVYARRFTASLTPLATEFQVNAVTTGTQAQPFIAAAGDTGYLITWGSGSNLLARRLDSDGVAVSDEMTIAINCAPFLRDVVGDANGNYLVAWTTVAGLHVMARRYSATFDTLGQPFLVSSATAGSQADPQLVMNSAGEFVAIWVGLNSGGGDNDGIFGRHFNAAGIPQGPDFRVNLYTTGLQQGPVAAMDAQGNFVVAWYGPRAGDDAGVASRRYTVAAAAPVASADFVWQGNTQHIAISFSEPDPALISSMTPSNVQLHNLTTGQIITPSAISTVPSFGESDSAIFTFGSLPNGMLPNGRYMVTVYPGNAPQFYAYSFEIFFINGDANHDGRADLYDLVALAPNWMMPSGFDYAKGDFNLDGIVNSSDLAILALNWQASLLTLPGGSPVMDTSAAPSRTATRTPTRVSVPVSSLVDLTAPPPAARTPVRTN